MEAMFFYNRTTQTYLRQKMNTITILMCLVIFHSPNLMSCGIQMFDYSEKYNKLKFYFAAENKWR
jgi:hypothetical protein